MTRIKALGVVIVGLAAGCGGDDDGSSVPAVNLDGFDLSPTVESAIRTAESTGDRAGGDYHYDETEQTLSVDLSASTFACDIETGTVSARITELTATRMVWDLSDGGTVTWTRVDDGNEGVVGVWETDEPELILVLRDDGSAMIVGEGGECESDGRRRNGDNCIEIGLSGASITVDGDLSDWDAVSASATLRDEEGDYAGDDPGADVRAVKVEFARDFLFVLIELNSAPSTSFQGRQAPNGGVYRLTVRGQNGLSLSERVAYSPETVAWATFGDAPQIAAAVGDDGIEWAVDVSAFSGEGFSTIDLILAEPIDCGAGSCQTLDSADCGYVVVP